MGQQAAILECHGFGLRAAGGLGGDEPLAELPRAGVDGEVAALVVDCEQEQVNYMGAVLELLVSLAALGELDAALGEIGVERGILGHNRGSLLTAKYHTVFEVQEN